MTKKLLIDSTHSEETRLAVLDNGKLADYDYESAARKQLKGNVFLAKVTRVEPSLQAAFVNYGGNRHGFLPFSEIHPDYFRIPVADKEKLLAEEERIRKEMEEAALAEDDDEDQDNDNEDTASADDADDSEDETDTSSEAEEASEDDESDDESAENEEDGEDGDGKPRRRNQSRRGRYGRRGRGGRRGASRREDGVVDEDAPQSIDRELLWKRLRRSYKIQEVIKRGQIMLIQVTKEERGNKGAAVTSYITLPGRYCVLMPNSPQGGGVSRKVADRKDRKKMRDTLRDLDIPSGMAVILRTAGVSRTKTEIKRDLDYLMRLWNQIREDTMQATAPELIYEEASLIKRAIRDVYDKDMSEVIVAGDEGYKQAKTQMKMMIPSHERRVKHYKDDAPLFIRHGIEDQIEDMDSQSVTLKSGGYLVINPTEALVSIDVNSGRATRERHIEETALRTNLEAADEVARQLRLRDLAGLVVIDFIDMENYKYNRQVERRLKDAMAGDRARVQIGRISNFGLMELSRQRLRPSLAESTFETCPHCDGTGLVKTTDAMALSVMRKLEREAIKSKENGKTNLQVSLHASVALYLFNFKRPDIAVLEERYGVTFTFETDHAVSVMEIEITSNKPKQPQVEADEDESGQDHADDEDKPAKPSRSRRRKSSKNEEDDQEENSQEPESKTDGLDKEEKPKRKRKAPAKKKSDAESKAKADEEEPVKPKAKRAPRKKAEKQEEIPQETPEAEPAEAKKIPIKQAVNDDAQESDTPKDYEVVNPEPKEKKKGWWSKVTGE